MSDQIEFFDGSNDRKYFTMVPNYILDHSSAIDQALYLQMRRFAGSNGVCFASKKTLMKKLGIGRNALNTSLEYIREQKWISENGKVSRKTAGGPQEVESYVINDLWKKNVDFYSKGGAESTPLEQGGAEMTQRGGSNDIKGGAEMTSIKIPIIKIERGALSYLEKIDPHECRVLSRVYKAMPEQIEAKAHHLAEWLKTNGKTKKDYRSFLMGTLLEDFGERKYRMVKVAKMVDGKAVIVKERREI